MHKILDLTLPIKTVSEANVQCHWAERHRRFKDQKTHVFYALKHEGIVINPPCKIRLVRVASRLLDDDNLRFSFKGIRDAICSYIFPHLLPGRGDDNPDITWEYGQEKISNREYFVLIQVFVPEDSLKPQEVA